MLTALLMMFFLGWGIWRWINGKLFSQTAKIVGAVLFLSLLSTTVYASGPKSQILTTDELRADIYLWNILKTKAAPYCVLGNTWPLLGLENISARQITTGGFPYYFEYRQPERVQLFDNMNKAPSIRYLEKALEITGAKECYFMTEEKWIYSLRKNQIIDRLNKMLDFYQRIGDVYIWHYEGR